MLESTKKTFFGNLNINNITVNRKFSKTVKPFFSDICKISNDISLTEKNKLSITTKKIPTPLRSISQILPKGLNLHESTGNISFENEESCRKLKESFGNENFSFELFPRKTF